MGNRVKMQEEYLLPEALANADNWRELTCTIDNCDRDRYNRITGWCARHYNRWAKTGAPEYKMKVCKANNCKEELKLSDLCRKHRAKLNKYGDYNYVKNTMGFTPHEKLEHYSNYLDNGCQLWTGSTLKVNRGYKVKEFGHLNVNIDGKNKDEYAHRLSYRLNIGDIPEGMSVIQSCGENLCINPQHLMLATHAESCQHQSTAHSDSTSGFRGVTWSKPLNKWIVQVKVSQQVKYGGSFTDLVEAANKAREMRLQMHTLHDEADLTPYTLADRFITTQNKRTIISAKQPTTQN